MRTSQLPLSELVAAVFYLAIITAFLLLSGCDSDTRHPERVPVAIAESAPPAPRAPAPAPAPVVEPAPRVVTFADAEAEYQAGRYEAAVDLFSEWTDGHADNAWGFYMLGLSARRAGNLDLAETSIRRALEIDPDHDKSRLNLARVLLDGQRPKEALVELDPVLSGDAPTGEAFRLQGRALHQQTRLQESADAYREAIRLDDSDAWAMNNLGLVLLDEKLFEQALPVFARANQIRTDVPVFLNNLGMALEHRGHYRDAEVAYARALEIDEAYNNAFENLNRIAAVAEDPQLVPIDLEAAANAFVDEIASWNDEAIPREEPVALARPDSTIIN